MPQHSSVVTRALCAAIALVALTLIFASVAPAATFNANAPSLGTITDSPAGGNICGDYTAAARDVTFTVAGLPLGAPADVALGFSLETVSGTGPGHPWVGDLEVELIAPGGAATKSIIDQTGSTTAAGCGDDSNALGPYTFSDSAPAAPTWLGAATTANDTTAIPTGSYRAATPGGVVGGGANTLITPAFAGLVNPNGTWTLRFRDGGQGDVGKVSAANLTVTPALPAALAVTKLGTGQGTITGPGIDCGLDCAEAIGKNTAVPLIAVPAAGSTFAGWTGCDAVTGNECTVLLSSDRVASATFNLPAAAAPPATSTSTTTTTQARKKKCGKGKKLKGGKCVKKHKRHKKKA